MNNRQAGRRRGRGGQRQGGSPGRPDNGNRIDNRARGNAAQLLEKYKSLAQDSQRSGDRVNTEYYLQFADHYFRVLSESRSRNEEQGQGQGQQARRPNDDDGDDDDFGYEGEVGSPATYGQGPQIRDDEDDREFAREETRRQPRDDRPREDRPREDRPREDRPRREGRGGNNANGNTANGNTGGNSNGNSYARDRDAQPRVTEDRDSRPAPREREARVSEDRPVAANDEPRGELRRRGRPPRAAAPVVESEGFDTSVLPPAIATDAPPSLDAVAEDRPRRGRPRRVRPDDDEAVPPAA